MLDAASTTSTDRSPTKQRQLDALLLGTIGLSRSGIDLLGANTRQPDPGRSTRWNPPPPADEVQPGIDLPARRRRRTCSTTACHGYTGGANGKSADHRCRPAPRRRPLQVPRQPAGHRRQGRPRRQAGLRITARRCATLAGPRIWSPTPAGAPDLTPAQPRHRLPRLRRLPSGHPGRPRAAQHPPRRRRRRRVRSPTRAHPPYGAPQYAPGRHTAVPGPAAGTRHRRTRTRRRTRLGTLRGATTGHRRRPPPPCHGDGRSRRTSRQLRHTGSRK